MIGYYKYNRLLVCMLLIAVQGTMRDAILAAASHELTVEILRESPCGFTVARVADENLRLVQEWYQVDYSNRPPFYAGTLIHYASF